MLTSLPIWPSWSLIRSLGEGFYIFWKLEVGITYLITYDSVYGIHYVIAYANTYVVTYPYAWTVNFEMRFEMQLRTYQPPIPNTSQTSAWSYKYNGRWMGKTESSPTGWRNNFGRLNCWKKNLSKSSRFRTSGSTFWSWSTGSRFGSVSHYGLAFGTAWQTRNYYNYMSKS